MSKKIINICLISLLTFLTIGVISVSAKKMNRTNSITSPSYQISTDTNFFTKPVDTTPVANPDLILLTQGGYKKVSESDTLELYYADKNFNIAIHDKLTGYIWFSNTSKTNKTNKSGLEIEIFPADSGISKSDIKTYVGYNKYPVTLSHTSIENGVEVTIRVESLGVTIVVDITLVNDKLTVYVPLEKIKEEGYHKEILGQRKDEDYYIKSLTLFENFGAENYEINGYSFIPDGSGALIKYTNTNYTVAYSRRVYGNDYGIAEESNLYDHLRKESIVSLPIYGVNHGYNQAAFLAVATGGAGSAELNSNPYMYSNKAFNTTYFKFYLREKYKIPMNTESSGTMTYVNDKMYDQDIRVEYNFLRNEQANYVGMANLYKNDYLNLTKYEAYDNIKLNLNVIGQDYKNGLFGKNYVEMTKYNELLEIIKDLEHDIRNFNIVYMGWNKGGYFDNLKFKPRVSSNLGSKKDLLELTKYISDNNYDISSYLDLVTSYRSSIMYDTVKKINMSVYEFTSTSSILEKAYFLNPNGMSDKVLDYKEIYEELDINSLALTSVGNSLSSYRYKSKNYFRSNNITTYTNELAKMANEFSLGLYEPNAYALDYTDKYYEASYESNKYTFITDSIPFISLLLSGYVELYSPNTNFISDYDLFALRLVEYNIAPSFIVTSSPTYNLRFTNFEYIYTSQYDLWHDEIIKTYNKVNNALKYVIGASMINHEYVLPGVAKVTYSNGKKIYINYNALDAEYNGITIQAMNYEVVS